MRDIHVPSVTMAVVCMRKAHGQGFKYSHLLPIGPNKLQNFKSLLHGICVIWSESRNAESVEYFLKGKYMRERGWLGSHNRTND